MTANQTEVLVVGAGLSGAVVSRELAAAGIEVTCLEQGDWQEPESYPGNRPDFELQALGPWHANPNLRGNPADYRILDDSSEIKPMLFNGVGGSYLNRDLADEVAALLPVAEHPHLCGA